MNFSYDHQSSIINHDCLDRSPFMFPISSSTLLSQTSSSMDNVRVERFPVFDDFGDVNFTHEFSVELEDDKKDVKENISAEGLLMSCLACSQRSKDNESTRSQSLPLSQSQNQNSQRSQHSSLGNFSQPLVISYPSSYGTSYSSSGTQPLADSQATQEDICCKKHAKYLKKNKKLGDKINNNCIIDVEALYAPTRNGYLKPPFSHNMLCAMAICNNPMRQQEVSEVYRFLMNCFPYFKVAGQHWKNSLRHSLATCDWFAKSDNPRTAKKGYKYTIRSTRKDCLKNEIQKQCIYDLSKLHYRLSGPSVTEILISMGLVVLSQAKLAELRQENRAFYNQRISGI